MALNYIHLCIIVLVIDSIEHFIVPSIAFSEDYEVEFLSVIFRHGDRTPEELYPNDPNVGYIDSTSFGHLTNLGKVRAYKLGTEIRRLYDDFLGETYVPSMIKARSTDYDRTKMSLMIVLSALYPPKGKQIWNPTLNWQPIPISYVPRSKDFLTAINSCPLYLEELIRVQNSEEVINQVENYRPLMMNLTDWTGKPINSSIEMLLLYHTLMSESSMGLELPKWTENIFPSGPLLDATILRLKILNYNIKLRRLFSGFLLKNIIESMNGIANKTIQDGRKIHLFSAHDTNIASFLISLNVFEPHVPEYTSAVIVELLRNKHKEYFVGIRYYLGSSPTVKVFHVPECDMNPCPLKKFIHFMGNMMPINDDALCSH
ncbi:hypothetical protein PV328_003163 [Microctonus aethiopoides]|uniref:acid phosphatase n=1 Tax=Microctonus aethiopoides TaxID=144406 RepID=A0AA39KKC5_9HYME|nr:hypothetical protein PV328_003163 [Microctonus aethiopoides]